MIHLKEITDKKGIDFVKNLLSQYVIASEKLDGQRFSIQKDETGNLQFFKRDGKTPISKVDRTLMKIFEDAIDHIESINSNVLESIPENYHIGFEYFYNTKPIAISYDRLPKNKLVLTDIQVRDKSGKIQKIIDDPDTLFEWADKLQVERYPLIYKGKLSNQQKTQIQEYLETPINKLIERFSTESFVRYIISILNPNMKRTALMDDLDKPIEGVVFKFMNTKDGTDFFAKIVDPIFTQAVKDKKSDKKDKSGNTEFIRFFNQWLTDKNLDSYKPKSNSEDGKYIELLTELFMDFFTNNEKTIEKFDITTEEFLQRDEFRINLKNIHNQKAKNLIGSDPFAHDIFKIILSTFRKIRKRATDEITKDLVQPLNNNIQKINNMIAGINESEILGFSEWTRMTKVIENYLLEGFSLAKQAEGLERVNFMVGRFQPPTLGHIKVIEQIYKQNGYPVVVFTVRAKNRNPEKTPFMDETISELFAKIKGEYSNLIADFIEIPSAGVDQIINSLRPKYEPVLWGTGSDRLKGYGAQIDRYKDYPGFPKIEMYEIKRGDDDISATKVREALRSGDKTTFNKMMPKSAYRYFDKLSSELK